VNSIAKQRASVIACFIQGKPFTAFKGYTTNILKLIGAENVMENAGVDKTWAAVSWENVVAADPEYIIIADYSNGIRNDDDFQQKVAAIKDNPQLANVKAVKGKSLHGEGFLPFSASSRRWMVALTKSGEMQRVHSNSRSVPRWWGQAPKSS